MIVDSEVSVLRSAQGPAWALGFGLPVIALLSPPASWEPVPGWGSPTITACATQGLKGESCLFLQGPSSFHIWKK